MAASSSGVVGNGRAERRRRWCNWEGVIFSAGAEDGEDGRRLRTDQVGFSRIEAAVGEFVVMNRVIKGLVECVMLRRRATRQDVQIVMVRSWPDLSIWI
jgi:hypothetical protein